MIEPLGLKVVSDDDLNKEGLETVRENVLIDFDEFGTRLPDADIVIYNPKDSRIISVISSKTSLRERIAHTGYWKFKLLASEKTAHIKLYLITPDTDKIFARRNLARKERVIVEIDLDGAYVLTKEDVEESDKVKLFEHFIEDFKKVIKQNR